MADETKITLQAPDGVTGQFHAQSSAVYQVSEGKVAVALKDVGDFLRLGFTHVVEKIEAAVEQVVGTVDVEVKAEEGATLNVAENKVKADESTVETAVVGATETVAAEAKPETQATEPAAVETVESVAEPAAQAVAN